MKPKQEQLILHNIVAVAVPYLSLLARERVCGSTGTKTARAVFRIDQSQQLYNNSRRATRLRRTFSECFESLKTMLYAQFYSVIRAVLRMFRNSAKGALSTFL